MMHIEHDEKQQLIAELKRSPIWSMGGIHGEKSVLASAGLSGDAIDSCLTGYPIIDAPNVIAHLKSIGHLDDRQEYTAIGALVEYLFEKAPDLEGKKFLASLIVRYRMIENEQFLLELRDQYSVSEIEPVEREAEPIEQVPNRSVPPEVEDTESSAENLQQELNDPPDIPTVSVNTTTLEIDRHIRDNWQRVVDWSNKIKKKTTARQLIFTGVLVVFVLGLFGLIKLITSPPQVDIEKFLIEKNGMIATVAPNEDITVTAGDIIKVSVGVSTPDQEKLEDLEFVWHTCHGGTDPFHRAIGDTELYYITPTEPGPDCIRVSIQQGELLLDKSEISVNVQK